MAASRRSTDGTPCSSRPWTSAGVKLKATTQLATGGRSSKTSIWTLLVRSSSQAHGRAAKNGRNSAANPVTFSRARLSQS